MCVCVCAYACGVYVDPPRSFEHRIGANKESRPNSNAFRGPSTSESCAAEGERFHKKEIDQSLLHMFTENEHGFSVALK